MSTTPAIDAAIGPIHASDLAHRWSALRARISVGRLDIELAKGADPWSSAQLMSRAARIGSLGERRKLATALAGVVEVAQAQGPTFSARITIRHRLVVEHAEGLLLLARRLRAPEPVDVAIVAGLALLLRDGRSALYAGGKPPPELTALIARSLKALDLT